MSAFNTPWNMRLEMAKKRGQQGGMGNQPNYKTPPMLDWNTYRTGNMQQIANDAMKPYPQPRRDTTNASINQVSFQRPMPQAQPTQPSPVPARPVGMGTSPAPAAPLPTYDPMARLELSRRLAQTKRERVAAAQGGQDIKSFKDAEYELRLQLAAMNRMRNADRAGEAEARDPGGIERARMLDKQLPGAMLAGNASASDAALRQLALRQRYNLPTDQPMQRLMDLTMEPIAPENPNYFADRAAPRDTTQMQIEARRQLAETMNRPTPGMNALDQRDAFARQMDQLDQRLAMAAQQRAIAEQEAMAKQYGGYIEGGVMSPDGEMQATEQAYGGFTPGGVMSPEAEMKATENAVGVVQANPQLSLTATSGVGAIAKFLNSPSDPQAKEDVRAFFRSFNALPPQQQEYLRRAVTAQLVQSGMTAPDLTDNTPMSGDAFARMMNQNGDSPNGMGVGAKWLMETAGAIPPVMDAEADALKMDILRRLFSGQ